MTEYVVTRDSDGSDIPAHRGHYQPGSISINRVPTAEILVRDPAGTQGAKFTTGVKFTIKRNGVSEFPGMVRGRARRTSNTDETVKATLVHRGYQFLRRWPCDGYIYDEDGDAFTTRDAVKVNPWLYRIFRQVGGALDANGDEPPLDGARVEDVARALIGTRLIVQHDFLDNAPFRASGVYASANKVQVYLDGQSGDARPKLQRVRKDNAGYLAGQALESIPLENGDPNVKAMGVVSTVAVTLIGELAGTQHPTLRVCRNARAGARTFTALALTHAANYLGSGLSAWTGSVDLSADGAAAKTSLGYELTIPGADADATTTKIHYITLTATTVGDIGLTAGTIDPYADPHGGADVTEWVEDDYLGMRRGDALERLRLGTLTDSAVNSSPHWDMWVDASLAFHFRQRRGTAFGTTYSHANGNLTLLEREDYADALAYQVIAVGGGRGQAEILLVNRTAYASGGLYDATRDPDSGALYGDAPDVLVYRDQSVTSRAELLRRARAWMAQYRDPRQYHRVSLIGFRNNDFSIGDTLPITEPDWGLTGELVRVMDMDRAWDGESGEALTVELGEKLVEPARALGGQRSERERAESRAAGATATNGVGGPGVYFDKTRFGRFAFAIPEGVEIERVLLNMQTLPWQATAKTAAAGGGSSPTTDAASHTHAGQNAASNTHSHAVTGGAGSAGQHSHKWAEWVSDTPGAFSNRRYQDGRGTLATEFNLESEDTSSPRTDAASGHAHDINIAADGGHTHPVEIGSGGSHQHTVTFAAHTHPLTFGIYQFDGDAGDGTGAPVYGQDIMFAVDPTLDAGGEPTTFSTQRHPAKLGTAAAPREISVDVTGYLRTLANGIIAPGEHRVYFLGAVAGTNAQGLSVVSVTPILKVREAQGA